MPFLSFLPYDISCLSFVVFRSRWRHKREDDRTVSRKLYYHTVVSGKDRRHNRWCYSPSPLPSNLDYNLCHRNNNSNKRNSSKLVQRVSCATALSLFSQPTWGLHNWGFDAAGKVVSLGWAWSAQHSLSDAAVLLVSAVVLVVVVALPSLELVLCAGDVNFCFGSQLSGSNGVISRWLSSEVVTWSGFVLCCRRRSACRFHILLSWSFRHMSMAPSSQGRLQVATSGKIWSLL